MHPPPHLLSSSSPGPRLIRGEGQLPPRDAVRESLRWSFSSPASFYHSLAWGIVTGLLNGLFSPPGYRIYMMLCMLAFAFGIGYLSPIGWRVRLHGGERVPPLYVALANGGLVLAVGFVYSFIAYCLLLVLMDGWDALVPVALQRIAIACGWSLIFPLLGFAIATGQLEDLQARQLAADNKRMEGLVEESRLVALRAQINPHFFFNALNTIAALIPERPRDAERAVELLATALRPALMREQPLVHTLERELAIANAYAEVEALRLGDRLRFDQKIVPEALPLLLPSLSLQPLLENAVTHGAARTVEATAIRLEARATEGVLHVRLSNGPAQQVPAAWEAMTPVTSPSGHAIHNIATRLRILFGEAAALDARAGDGPSGEVRLTVPQGAMRRISPVGGASHDS